MSEMAAEVRGCGVDKMGSSGHEPPALIVCQAYRLLLLLHNEREGCELVRLRCLVRDG